MTTSNHVLNPTAERRCRSVPVALCAPGGGLAQALGLIRVILRRYGLWIITVRGGCENPYFLDEDRSGNWVLTPFQRHIGAKYHGTGGNRYPNWKGFFASFASHGPPRSLLRLLAEYVAPLKLPRGRIKFLPGANASLATATGVALLWAPHLRLVSDRGHARLAAIVTFKGHLWP